MIYLIMVQVKDFEKLPLQYLCTIVFSFKNRKFQWQHFDIFKIFAQNIDFWYMLELPRKVLGGSYEYPQSIYTSLGTSLMFALSCMHLLLNYNTHQLK